MAEVATFSAPSSGWALVWRRFRQERLGMAALVGLTLIVLGCFMGEPLLVRLLGHGPDTFFPSAVDINLRPVGPWSHVRNESLNAAAQPGTTFFLLGGDGPLGRDEFLRILAGGRLSLEIAFIATAIGVVVGVTLGALAGWFGGLVDAVVGRMTELVMAFPILLLVIAIGQTIAVRFDAITIHGLFEPGVVALGVTIGIFSWFYPARVVRALTQSLREYEFVEAARMTGASELRILRKHVLPHLAGPVIVWATLVASGVIILEAALSILNFGVKLGTASWGSLLSDAWGSLLVFNPMSNSPQYSRNNWLMLWPSLTLFLTVLCLALVGDGLRNALDPRRGEG
ncbi:MAG: dipeptide transport system permease protein dppC [Actinomycetia bacterium]|nr:dipeptide transport system permease protein dppC [Actinomycetes bacterium]